VFSQDSVLVADAEPTHTALSRARDREGLHGQLISIAYALPLFVQHADRVGNPMLFLVLRGAQPVLLACRGLVGVMESPGGDAPPAAIVCCRAVLLLVPCAHARRLSGGRGCPQTGWPRDFARVPLGRRACRMIPAANHIYASCCAR
jgi:hypothetical protein